MRIVPCVGGEACLARSHVPQPRRRTLGQALRRGEACLARSHPRRLPLDANSQFFSENQFTVLTLQRITSEYVATEDRFRLSGITDKGGEVSYWVTQRLLLRLLNFLLDWLIVLNKLLE